MFSRWNNKFFSLIFSDAEFEARQMLFLPQCHRHRCRRQRLLLKWYFCTLVLAVSYRTTSYRTTSDLPPSTWGSTRIYTVVWSIWIFYSKANRSRSHRGSDGVFMAAMKTHDPPGLNLWSPCQHIHLCLTKKNNKNKKKKTEDDIFTD